MRRTATSWVAIVVSAPIATSLVVCALSCSSFSAANDPSNTVTDAATADGTTTDAEAATDATDATPTTTDSAAPDGGQPNLFPLGDFEVGGCSGGSYYSVLTSDSTAHGGNTSCRVCTAPTSPDVFAFDADLDGVTPQLGAHYSAEAWIRATPDVPGNAPTSGVELALRTYTDPPFTIHDNEVTARAPLTSTWQRLTVDLVITQSGMTKLSIIVDGVYQNKTCFLVDDIVVRRQ